MVTNSFGNSNFMQPMGRLSIHSMCLDFFLLSFRGGGGRFFFFFSFFHCSQHVLQVPNGFPSGSQYVPWVPNVFLKGIPIAPCFNPICFVQSPPLLTYIAGPKWEALHLSIKCSIFGILNRCKLFY
jgi:hypothetical protein